MFGVERTKFRESQERTDFSSRSIFRGQNRFTLPFHTAAKAFFTQPAFLRLNRRYGFPPMTDGFRCFSDPSNQPVLCIPAVLLPGAETIRIDDQYPLTGDSLPGEPDQPLAYLLGKRSGVADIETQLHRGRHLVDVLPAGAGRPDESLPDLVLVELDGARHADHSFMVSGCRRGHRSEPVRNAAPRRDGPPSEGR